MFYTKIKNVILTVWTSLLIFFLTARSAFAQFDFIPIVPCEGATDCDFQAFGQLIDNLINFLLLIAPILAAMAFAVAGFYYLTSAGDTGKVKKAHQIFQWTLIGLVVALAAWLIVKAILLGLGVKTSLIFLDI